MKKNKLLLISFLLAIAYILYSASYWLGCLFSPDYLNVLSSSIAINIIMPHLILSLLATLFNGVALFTNNRSFALIAAIFYLLALALFPLYFFFVIGQATLCLIAFFKMKKVA